MIIAVSARLVRHLAAILSPSLPILICVIKKSSVKSPGALGLVNDTTPYNYLLSCPHNWTYNRLTHIYRQSWRFQALDIRDYIVNYVILVEGEFKTPSSCAIILMKIQNGSTVWFQIYSSLFYVHPLSGRLPS